MLRKCTDVTSDPKFNGIRLQYDADEEDIYDYVCYDVRRVLQEIGKYDFNSKPKDNLSTQQFKAYDDGHKYFGQVNPQTNKYEGQGIYVFGSDSSIYEGFFRNNLANGRGRMIYANAQVYEGEWRNFKRHGYGTLM